MAVREFTDRRGTAWRVWEVTPEHMHPATRGEDYLSNFQDGWLTFESSAEKRRLEAPYPGDWTTLSIPALEALAQRATPVLRRATPLTTAAFHAAHVLDTERTALESAHAQITFDSPGGREWTVRVHECLDHAGAQQEVLRFSAGDIVVDLPDFPANWQSSTVTQFAMMLLDADPPRRLKNATGPQRRHDDRASTDRGSMSADSPRVR